MKKRLKISTQLQTDCEKGYYKKKKKALENKYKHICYKPNNGCSYQTVKYEKPTPQNCTIIELFLIVFHH